MSEKSKYFLPSVTIGVIYLIILALNGMWPFGKATIDYYDMAQWSDLFYYHNYDVLHGTKSFVFDWYTNLGRVIPGLNEPSLFDLFFYFVPRDLFLECTSILMLIKIMVSALTMNIFIGYINKDLPYIYRFIISAGYGMCGFMLLNYTVPMWIDMMAIVPLVLMSSQKALKTGKILGLSVTVFLLMTDDYYFTIQTLVFVFMIGGIFMLCSLINDRNMIKRLYLFRFASGVVLGLGLSAFSWIPDIVFAVGSARFGNGTAGESIMDNYLMILRNTEPAYLTRWFVLLCLAMPSALAVVSIISDIRRKNTSRVVFCLICVFMTASQLVLESIHMLLHFGSYVNYPVRNGFMIYLVVSGIAAALYEKKNPAQETQSITSKGIPIQVILSSIAAVAAAVLFRRWYVANAGISGHSVLMMTMGMMLAFMIVHIILMVFSAGRYAYVSVGFWVAELLIFGIIMIGKPLFDTPYGNDPEQEGEFIRITDQLVSGFGDIFETGKTAATRRVKNPDTGLNANYGEVMQRETLSGWSNLETPGQIGGAISLGYSNQFTRLLDSGGNIFSDTMLHITDIISREELDETLYEKVAKTDAVIDHMTGEKASYNLYRNRYELPFAMAVNAILPKFDSRSDPVEVFNSYVSALGADKSIAGPVQTKPDVSHYDDHEVSDYSINVSGRKTLYFKGYCTDKDYYNTKITVNEKTVKIPSIREYDNELFPAHFNNNTIELGSFEDETVRVTIDMDLSDPDTEYSFVLYEIDRDVLEDLCSGISYVTDTKQGKRSLEITIDDIPGSFDGVIIPVSYDKGWSAFVNGSKTDILDCNGLFMYIPVTSGYNEIKMTYFPAYMKTGIIIALIAAVSLAAIMFSDRKKPAAVTGTDTVLTYLYVCAAVAAFIVIYLIPAVYAVVLGIKA